MTKEELREHCEKQVKMCEEWAKGNDREPSGKIYEEHKLILDLIKALEQAAYYKNLAQSYEKTINKLTKAIADQQPSDDCISRTQAIEWMENLRQMDECFGNYEDDYFPLSEVIDRLKNVPPVTPTHGTCKDCKHFHNVRKDFNTCDLWTIACADNHYCADYEKRGSEDGSN